jgi:hypothetical protein
MNMVKEQKQLSPGKVIKEGGFKQGLYALPYNQIAQARKEICALCYWSYGTFRIKLAGARPFLIFEVKELDAYFSARGINAWTGEKLNNQQ